MSSIGSFTSTYDSNGDVLNDALHSYAWDVDTRPTTIDTVTVTYDALERMVEQSKSGSNTEIVYDALGNKLALMNGTSTLVKAFGAVLIWDLCNRWKERRRAALCREEADARTAPSLCANRRS